jgi:emopamil binding protein
MTEASTVGPFSCPRSALCTKDKVVIALVVLYSSVALTLELYWIIFNQVMEFRTDLVARVLQFYWPADHSWRIPGFPAEKAFVLSLELVNVFLTPILSAMLIWAIVKRRSYRYPLQLLISTYTAYGTALYYAVTHISDYAIFEYKGVYTYALFYFANMPWLVGYAWLAWDAYRCLSQASKGPSAAPSAHL